MSSIKCLIVDDEPLAIKVIQRHVDQIPGLTLVASCQNAIEALELLKTEKIDLIFLDIQMPVLTGLDFVQSLTHPPSIIFITAYRNYAVESYELNVVDYLVKPVSFTRFLKAVNKYMDQNKAAPIAEKKPLSPLATTPDHIFVNANKKHIKVSFDQILYVESLKDYVSIYTATKRIITKDKISEFEKKLPTGFVRVHRSFIVNTKKITAFTANDIEINDKEIPIGVSYKKTVWEKLT